MPFSLPVSIAISSISGGTVFSFTDIVTQRVEIKFKKRGLAAEIRDGKNPRVCGYIETKPVQPPALKFKWTRSLKMGCIGLMTGAAFVPTMQFADSLLPGSHSVLGMLAKAFVVETILAPPTIAATLAVAAQSQDDSSTESVFEKFKVDFAQLFVAHLFFAPALAISFSGISMPFPGFSARIPAHLLMVVTQLPYLGLLSYKAFRPPGTHIQFTMPFDIWDLLSVRTAAALGLWAVCGYFNCIGQLATDYIGTKGVIWDPLFVILPHIPMVAAIDGLIGVSVALMFGHMILRNNPPLPVTFRRIWTIHAFLLLTRMITLPLGALFLPSPDLTCEMVHPWPFPLGALMVESGTGHTCNDLFFSGHTVYFMLAALYFHDYTKNKAVKIGMWSYTSLALLTVVATHAHYTIDVVAAMGFTYGYWKYYHKLIQMDTDSPDAKGFKVKLAAMCKWIQNYNGEDKYDRCNRIPDRPKSATEGFVTDNVALKEVVMCNGKDEKEEAQSPDGPDSIRSPVTV